MMVEAAQVIPVYDAPLSPVLQSALCWRPSPGLATPSTAGWTGCQPRRHEHHVSCRDGMHTCPVELMSGCTVTMEIITIHFVTYKVNLLN